MSTPADQLDAPVLAVFTCGGCECIVPYHGHMYCATWDKPLKTNGDNKPLRCTECLRDARGDLND